MRNHATDILDGDEDRVIPWPVSPPMMNMLVSSDTCDELICTCRFAYSDAESILSLSAIFKHGLSE